MHYVMIRLCLNGKHEEKEDARCEEGLVEVWGVASSSVREGHATMIGKGFGNYSFNQGNDSFGGNTSVGVEGLLSLFLVFLWCMEWASPFLCLFRCDSTKSQVGNGLGLICTKALQGVGLDGSHTDSIDVFKGHCGDVGETFSSHQLKELDRDALDHFLGDLDTGVLVDTGVLSVEEGSLGVDVTVEAVDDGIDVVFGFGSGP